MHHLALMLTPLIYGQVRFLQGQNWLKSSASDEKIQLDFRNIAKHIGQYKAVVIGNCTLVTPHITF